MAPVRAWLRDLRGYATPRLVTVFFLGISSGFPLTLLISTLAIWLRREGVGVGEIGLISLALTPYTLKFLWSPLIDRLRIPVLARRLGHRRSWLYLTQAVLFTGIVLMAAQDPRTGLGMLVVFITLVAFASATQDIVIDAYRIEILSDSEQGRGASMIQFGYRTGNLIAGAGALVLATEIGWQATFTLMAFLVLAGAIAAFLTGEPARFMTENAEAYAEQARTFAEHGRKIAHRWATAIGWLYSAVVAPFLNFFERPGAMLILVFVLIYKAGDAMAAIMTAPLLVDLGFTNIEIAWANKAVGVVALIVGIAIGGILADRMDIFRALMFTGVLMMVSNLLFAVLAMVGDQNWMLALTIGFENFSSGMGLAVFVAYLSGLCNHAFTATQYALLSSFAAVGRTFLVSPSGFLVEAIGYVDFFFVTTAAALPGLVVLILLWRFGYQAQESTVRAGE